MAYARIVVPDTHALALAGTARGSGGSSSLSHSRSLRSLGSGITAAVDSQEGSYSFPSFVCVLINVLC